MQLVLALFGGYFLFVGVVLVSFPLKGKRMVNWWLKDKLYRPWAILPAAIGLFILWAVPASKAPIFIQILGWAIVIKAGIVLVMPKPQLLRFVNWWNQLPEIAYRIWGGVAGVFGLAVLLTL